MGERHLHVVHDDEEYLPEWERQFLEEIWRRRLDVVFIVPEYR